MARAFEKTVSATEFKAKCLELMDQLDKRVLHRIFVTKRGRVVSVVSPPPFVAGPDNGLPAAFGWMKGSVIIPEGFDWDKPAITAAEIEAMVIGTLAQLNDDPAWHGRPHPADERSADATRSRGSTCCQCA